MGIVCFLTISVDVDLPTIDAGRKSFCWYKLRSKLPGSATARLEVESRHAQPLRSQEPAVPASNRSRLSAQPAEPGLKTQSGVRGSLDVHVVDGE